MFEKLDKCPICNNDKLINHFICKDNFLTGESFAIVRCEKCSFLFTNPRPNQESISKYYQSDEYISHSNKANNITNTLYKIARNFTLSNKLKLINSLTNNKILLDFGCGAGEFLLYTIKNGWIIHGYEPDEFARSKASKITKNEIIGNVIDLEKINQVEVITFWHVLEHVHNLNETIHILKNKLSKTGKMIIAVPNYESMDAQIYREFWAAYDVPRHLYHFSMKTMKLLLKNHGLRIISIKPMKLDSFYVSLLSEKYKYGRQNYLKSFINGYKSNSYAKQNNDKYSSLIYIAGK